VDTAHDLIADAAPDAAEVDREAELQADVKRGLIARYRSVAARRLRYGGIWPPFLKYSDFREVGTHFVADRRKPAVLFLEFDEDNREAEIIVPSPGACELAPRLFGLDVEWLGEAQVATAKGVLDLDKCEYLARTPAFFVLRLLPEAEEKGVGGPVGAAVTTGSGAASIRAAAAVVARGGEVPGDIAASAHAALVATSDALNDPSLQHVRRELGGDLDALLSRQLRSRLRVELGDVAFGAVKRTLRLAATAGAAQWGLGFGYALYRTRLRAWLSPARAIAKSLVWSFAATASTWAILGGVAMWLVWPKSEVQRRRLPKRFLARCAVAEGWKADYSKYPNVKFVKEAFSDWGVGGPTCKPQYPLAVAGPTLLPSDTTLWPFAFAQCEHNAQLAVLTRYARTLPVWTASRERVAATMRRLMPDAASMWAYVDPTEAEPFLAELPVPNAKRMDYIMSSREFQAKLIERRRDAFVKVEKQQPTKELGLEEVDTGAGAGDGVAEATPTPIDAGTGAPMATGKPRLITQARAAGANAELAPALERLCQELGGLYEEKTFVFGKLTVSTHSMGHANAGHWSRLAESLLDRGLVFRKAFDYSGWDASAGPLLDCFFDLILEAGADEELVHELRQSHRQARTRTFKYKFKTDVVAETRDGTRVSATRSATPVHSGTRYTTVGNTAGTTTVSVMALEDLARDLDKPVRVALVIQSDDTLAFCDDPHFLEEVPGAVRKIGCEMRIEAGTFLSMLLVPCDVREGGVWRRGHHFVPKLGRLIHAIGFTTSRLSFERDDLCVARLAALTDSLPLHMYASFFETLPAAIRRYSASLRKPRRIRGGDDLRGDFARWSWRDTSVDDIRPNADTVSFFERRYAMSGAQLAALGRAVYSSGLREAVIDDGAWASIVARDA
jgi:hypothetical protein